MLKKLLISSNDFGETRIAVIENEILQLFDSELENKKPIKDNIYLAQVVRVEPSLQAVFVEYGESRNGFLSFSEINSTYFNLPEEDFVENESENLANNSQEIVLEKSTENKANNSEEDTNEGLDEIVSKDQNEASQQKPYKNLHKKYLVQDVIKRNQTLLVQISKEERLNKGAALTTYISLSGKYCILRQNFGRNFPNGVSRKITDTEERKRLKNILEEIKFPEDMSMILRTASENIKKIDIIRDFKYLLRLWGDIKSLAGKSTPPKLIYEEANLVRKAIRDLYSRDMDEVLIEGDSYKDAKSFISKLMPSHARKIKQYKDTKHRLFTKYRIEQQINAMFDPIVNLPSGGYIVINNTEALTVIDVNSGKDTNELNIEDMAFKINIESSCEIARQIKLRNIGGLIVVDFIDMKNPNNIAALEKKFKDEIKFDKARTSVSKISDFGLMEISRQRIKQSFVEKQTIPCMHCNGNGSVRSSECASIQMLRYLDSNISRNRNWLKINFFIPKNYYSYFVNVKRRFICNLEIKYSISVSVFHDSRIVLPNGRIQVVKEKLNGNQNNGNQSNGFK